VPREQESVVLEQELVPMVRGWGQLEPLWVTNCTSPSSLSFFCSCPTFLPSCYPSLGFWIYLRQRRRERKWPSRRLLRLETTFYGSDRFGILLFKTRKSQFMRVATNRRRKLSCSRAVYHKSRALQYNAAVCIVSSLFVLGTAMFFILSRFCASFHYVSVLVASISLVKYRSKEYNTVVV